MQDFGSVQRPKVRSRKGEHSQGLASCAHELDLESAPFENSNDGANITCSQAVFGEVTGHNYKIMLGDHLFLVGAAYAVISLGDAVLRSRIQTVLTRATPSRPVTSPSNTYFVP